MKLWLILLLALFVRGSVADQFSEELFMRKLPDGHLYAHFNFVINRGFNETHYDLFPKSLAEVFAQYDVNELHLSVTQGLWRHRRWGYPLHSEAPGGTQLWTWFHPDTSNVDLQWKRLTSALSGAFCTSLQFMDAKSTATPRFSYRMGGVSSKRDSMTAQAKDKLLARHAALPGETPCTNTLTPWTKLLPCHTKSGLGSLLEPHSIFSASYAAIGLHYTYNCQFGAESCTQPDKQLILSLALVYNPKITNLARHLSLRRMFVRDIQAPCVLASSSKIFVNKESFPGLPVASPTPSNVHLKKFIEYSTQSPISFPLPFDMNVRFDDSPLAESSVPISVHRYLAGYGQQSGTVVCQIDNHLDNHVAIVYSQMFPWFVYLYLHSLKIVGAPYDEARRSVMLQPGKLNYSPSRLREKPTLLELAFMLPPRSRTTITLDVDYQLLRWTEYPPDANHGFYINSGTITAVLPADEASGFVIDSIPLEFSTFSDYLNYRATTNGNVSDLTFLFRIYTESLIVYVPTPDFSMPYNALCLVCTVVAIGFGSVHSLTTKRFVLVDPENPPASAVSKVKIAIAKFRARLFGDSSSNEQTKKDDDGTDKKEK